MKHTELLNAQTSANETDKQKSNSEQLVKREEIERTPFTYVELQEEKFIALGRFKLRMVENFAEAKKVVHGKTDWDFLINVISAINTIDKIENLK